jgi:RNA polymerase sigma-70 factor (ECF subfamily)
MTRPADGMSSGGQGDEEAFRSLYRQYYSGVGRFFKARGFSPEDSQDLAQETFIRVFRAIDSFRGDGTLASWLYQIASNVARNELRSRHAARRYAWNERSIDEYLAESADDGPMEPDYGARSVDLPPVEPASLESALARERSQLFSKALEGLPPTMRRCVVLRVHQELKYREIAQVLNISIGAVKANLYDARARLKHHLGEPP